MTWKWLCGIYLCQAVLWIFSAYGFWRLSASGQTWPTPPLRLLEDSTPFDPPARTSKQLRMQQWSYLLVGLICFGLAVLYLGKHVLGWHIR